MRFIVCAAAAVLLAGCASNANVRTYAKPAGADRHTVVIDRLECRKQAVQAHRSTLARSTALDTTARARANVAAARTEERCIAGRGWKRVR